MRLIKNESLLPTIYYYQSIKCILSLVAFVCHRYSVWYGIVEFKGAVQRKTFMV